MKTVTIRKGAMPLAIAALFVNLCPPTMSAEFGSVCDTGGTDIGQRWHRTEEWGAMMGPVKYFYSTFRIWFSNLL